MTDVSIHPDWIERQAERFDSRTFVTDATYADTDGELPVSRGHIAYYADSHTVEVCVDGEYTFHYHERQNAAYDTIEREMKRVSDTLEAAPTAEFWSAFTHDKEGEVQ